MIKKIYIVTILFFVFIANGQEDSLSKRTDWLSHFAGIDIGYTDYYPIAGHTAEANLNYVFNPQYFCVKAQLGIAPGTNFGTLKKGFIGIGYSTKTSRFLSWHLITGIGTVKPSKSYSVTESEYNNPQQSTVRTYEFSCNTIYLESGLYLKPKKSKRLIFGLNATIHSSSIVEMNVSEIYQATNNAVTTNINFSLNFKLNK